MRLLEFHYWSDVVMVGTIATFVVALIILRFSVINYKNQKELKDEQLKQEIMDKLNKAISDIKTTV